MGKNGKKLPTLYTIWVQQIGETEETSKLIKRTKISFFDKQEALEYKNYLNKGIAELNIADYRYVILEEESTIFKHASDLIFNANEYSILCD